MVVVASVFSTEQGGSTTSTMPLPLFDSGGGGQLFDSTLFDFLSIESFTHTTLRFDLEVSELGCCWIEFSSLV